MDAQTIAPLLAGTVLGQSDGDFVIAEWSDPANPACAKMPIAPLHVHADDEAWYVLEGSLCVQVGEQEVRAEAGAAVLVPGGTPHTFWNPGPGPVRYLLVMTSNIHNLIQEFHTLEPRTPETVRALFASHGCTLLE